MDYSHKDLRGRSFHNADLHDACFIGSDLRGADFSGANLNGANLSHSSMGFTFATTMVIFLITLIVSAASGYMAMLAGNMIQQMLSSPNLNMRTAGIVTVITTAVFIIYSWWRGVGNAVTSLLIPIGAIALLIGTMMYSLGLGTGIGVFYLIAAFLLVVIMFVIGTAARTAANSLSPIIFIVVALTGSIFGRSVGGGIGAAVMAISCAMISRRAVSGARGFGALRRIGNFLTQKFGTSFHDADLSRADLSSSRVRNSDFSDANISSVRWGSSKLVNCITDVDKTKSR